MDAVLSWIGSFWTWSTVSPTSIKIVFGTAGLPRLSVEEVEEVYQVLQRHEVKDLDTAHIYVSLMYIHCLHHFTDILSC